MNNINLITEDCENGFIALNKIYKNFLENKQFDLLISDETMPYMSGSILINLINKLSNDSAYFNKIPTISYTSYTNIERKNYILAQGADAIISKPMTYDDFSLNIKKYLKL